VYYTDTFGAPRSGGRTHAGQQLQQVVGRQAQFFPLGAERLVQLVDFVVQVLDLAFQRLDPRAVLANGFDPAGVGQQGTIDGLRGGFFDHHAAFSLQLVDLFAAGSNLGIQFVQPRDRPLGQLARLA